MAINLGKLAGGDVVTVDFNFAVTSEPSSATIGVMSEDGSYANPPIGSLVKVNAMNSIDMFITEIWTDIEDEKTSLKLELVDRSSILDRNWISVRGVHTSGVTDNFVGTDAVYNISALPLRLIPSNILSRTGDFAFKQAGNGNVVKYNDTVSLSSQLGVSSIYLLGRFRSIFQPSGDVKVGDTTYIIDEASDFYLVYESGALNRALSRIPAAFQSETLLDQVVKENLSDVSKEIGYTLSDLRNALNQAGIAVLDTKNVFNDDRILFSESGTFRSCLSSTASRFGFSFFWDVFKNKLVIVSRDDIIAMNRDIRSLYGTYVSGNSEAIQMSFKESIQGSVARSALFRSVFNPKDQNRGGGDSQEAPPAQPRRTTFKAIDFFNNTFTGVNIQFPATRLFWIFRYKFKDPKELFDKFIVGAGLTIEEVKTGFNLLAPFYRTRQDGDPDLDANSKVITYHLYTDCPNQRLEDITFGRNDTKYRPPQDLFGANNKENQVFYDLSIGIKPIQAGEAGIQSVDFVKPSAVGLYDLFKVYFEKIGGIFISRRFGESDAKKMSFEGEGYTVGGPYAINTLLEDINELSDIISAINGLLTPEEANAAKSDYTNSTIEDLLLSAGYTTETLPPKPLDENGDPTDYEGDEGFYFIAVKDADLPNETSFDKKQNKKKNKEIIKRRQEIEREFEDNIKFESIGGREIIGVNNNIFLYNLLQESEESYNLWVKYRKSDPALSNLDEDEEENDVPVPVGKISLAYTVAEKEGFSQEGGDGTPYDEIPEIVSVDYLPPILSNNPFMERDVVMFETNEISAASFRANSAALVGQNVEIQYEVQATYHRLPTPADFGTGNTYKGMDSLRISSGPNGVQTTINYSTKKFTPTSIDVIADKFGTVRPKRNHRKKRNAVAKNILES